MFTIYLHGITCPQMRTLLECHGYTVIAVGSDEELMACIQSSASPTGVVAEVPRWNCQVLDLIATIIQLCPNAKVVLITPQPSISEVVYAMKAGAVSLLRQTIDTWTLANIVHQTFESIDPGRNTPHVLAWKGQVAE